MGVIMMMFILALCLSCILIFLNSLISKHSTLDREKPSPFECGFDLKTLSRNSFSIRFFLIAVIFLVFDVEITLILPLPLINTTIMIHWPLIVTLLFILILIMGLFHEWNEGSLQWK